MSQEKIQVFYEMSLSITPESDVEQTAKSAVSTYLQKLNCSAAAVFRPMGLPSAEGRRAVVTTLPERDVLAEQISETRGLLPDTEEEVVSALPLVSELESGMHRYVMSLPNFGVLLLLKRGSPLSDDVLLSLQDINEKLATACNRVAAQKQYETQYQTLFQEAPVMFALTKAGDGDPIIEDCNNRFAEKLGYAAEQLRDSPLTNFYTEASREKLLDGGYEDVLEGRFGTKKRVLRTKDGQEIVTKMRATPRYDRNGEAIGMRVLFVDITELKRRKVQVSVLNRVLRHNIRNDLTVIKGWLNAAMNDARDPTKLRKAYQKTEDLISIAEHARQIQRFINKSEIKRHDAADLIGSILSRAHSEFPDATIEATIEPESVSVLGTSALQHALWELIKNACKHAGASPLIRVTVEKQEATASIAVADDGPGIPPMERQILGEGKESKLEHGNGLGLWLIYWVISMSGGELTFDCEEGTVVTVTLPLAERQN